MSGSRRGLFHQVIDAIFRDIPGELDRLFRESEFASNRLFNQPRVVKSLGNVPRTARRFHSSAVLGVATLMLLFFGPTFDSLCTALGRTTVLVILALAAVLLLFGVITRLPRLIRWWLSFPDEAGIDAALWLRRFVVRAMLILGSMVPLGLLLIAGFAAWDTLTLYDNSLCASAAASRLPSIVQFVAFASISLFFVLSFRIGMPLHRSHLVLVTGLVTIAGASQALTVFLLADGAEREALNTPYLHIFTFGVLVLFLLAFVARYFAIYLFRPVHRDSNRKALRQAVTDTELFQFRKADVPSDTHIVDAFFRGLYGNLGLTFLPACLITLVSAPDFVKQSFAAGLIIALLLNTWSRLNTRWNTIFSLVNRWFFVGWPSAISYLVILIGLTRFAGVSYVTTIVDTAPLGFFPVLIALGYATLWFFEYWINREVGKQYLGVLGADAGEDWMPYVCTREEGLTSVMTEQRWLQLHGSGRVAVVGYYPYGKERRLAWHTYTYGDLLDRLRARITDLDAESASDRQAANAVIDDMKRRNSVYFSVINTTIAAVLIVAFVLGVQANNSLTRDPVAVGTSIAADDPRRFSLADVLADRCADDKSTCDEVVAVAASGGGSRAAMHTVAVLKALAAEDKIDDVVLVSGVSGGGASLGYFAAHHASLVQGFPAPAWECFTKAMSASFIQQVVESIGEMRMVRRTTLAHTLAESLEQEYNGTECGPAQTTDFVDVANVGLILNTTVAGHPPGATPVGSRLFGDTDLPSTEVAGARLVFTNLAELSAFSTFDEQGNDWSMAYPDAVAMPYRLVTAAGVTLPQAAALNANFPPVFPNSEVLIKNGLGGNRYFVTDGGVTENRGILSLILALQSAITELERIPEQDRGGFPDIRIVVADAGSLSYGYSPDRGIGTAVSGGPQVLLANAWLQEMLDNVINRYRELAGASIVIEPRPMPAALRLSGAIGTHWMLPATVYLQDPRTPFDSSDDRLYRLDRREAICLILHETSLNDAACSEFFISENWPRIEELIKTN